MPVNTATAMAGTTTAGLVITIGTGVGTTTGIQARIMAGTGDCTGILRMACITVSITGHTTAGTTTGTVVLTTIGTDIRRQRRSELLCAERPEQA